MSFDTDSRSPQGSIHRAASTVEEFQLRQLALDQAVRTHGDSVDENQVVAASIEYLTFLTGGLRLCDMDGDQLRAELTRRKDGMIAAGDEMMKRAAVSQGLGQTPPLVELPTMPDVVRTEQMVAAADNAAKELVESAMKGVRGLYQDEAVLKGTQDGIKELSTIVVQELRRFHAHYLAIIDAELASRKAL